MPLRGATTDRCIARHRLPGIDLRTTKGASIVRAKLLKVSFHQALSDQNCLACHSDHATPKLTQRSRKPFSHAMLGVATRDQGDTCHAAPTNASTPATAATSTHPPTCRSSTGRRLAPRTWTTASVAIAAPAAKARAKDPAKVEEITSEASATDLR